MLADDQDDQGIHLVRDGGRTLLTRILEGLADSRRRQVLYYLHDTHRAEIDELARHIVSNEQNIPTEEVPENRKRSLKTELAHVHLPKLDDDRLIDYDHRSGTVRYSNSPDALDDLIEVVRDIED